MLRRDAVQLLRPAQARRGARDCVDEGPHGVHDALHDPGHEGLHQQG